ncbi:MAG: Nif11-like leader peptide family natural product precursor [Atopobiaceae bacterium]|nr:Nif11-like leader peptide family natural product precursor [Atopobiaceae bacterium]MBR1828799.1 Nif11-like leader peptide family natural product precursor [Atopobiaceae bacterium]
MEAGATNFDTVKNFEDIDPRLREMLAKCETAEDILKLAKQEGIELTDEDLDAIAGAGAELSWTYVPSCSKAAEEG